MSTVQMTLGAMTARTIVIGNVSDAMGQLNKIVSNANLMLI